ncbi:MAG: hypothetical protein B7Y90_17460 [Alphaproteobacteria bacterium 32-64-14]|nr:MAG: hypothetical protein B7Y90_17460 [Alphaproteobacteria bacterium 32-64-14]
MKRLMLAAVLLAAPAFAQTGGTEIEVMGRGLINRWIAAYNRADSDAMMKDIYANGDLARLKTTFFDLNAESFGKLDAYSAAFCSTSATNGKALLRFTRLYTFGGKMNDDEAKVFDLVRTGAGWRIAAEVDVPYSTVLSCF